MFSGRTFGAGLLLSLSVFSFSQSRLDSLQVLEQLTIVGDRFREVVPSQRLSGEKLEALSSFSVADAIRYFSGIQIKDYGGIGGLKTVDIRSMGTNHSGVFYDGIQLGNAQNGQIDLGKFSLDNIEEISLYNGQKSEIFQPAKDFGSAGTIYLRTRRPRFAGTSRTNLVACFRTGSFETVNPSVLWEQKIAKNTSSSLNAEYIYSSGRYPFRYRKLLPDKTVAWDTTAIRRNGDIHALRLEGGLNGYVAGKGYWQGKIYFYNSERGIPGAIVNNVWKRSQRQWDRNFFAQFSSKNIIPLPEKCELLLNLKYANDWLRYLNPDTTLLYIDNSFLQQEIYASAAGKYSIMQNWEVNLAVDYQYNTLSSNMADFAFPARNTLLVAAATAIEWKRLKTQASLLGTFVRDDVQNGIQAGNKPEYTPAIFLSYQPWREHNIIVRAFYKRIFRMPTFNDLYYTDMGNTELRPEFTTQYNLGLQFTKKAEKGMVGEMTFRADAYYNEITDKIVAIPKGNGQFRWMMMNLDHVQIRGIDFSGQVAWRLPADIKVNTGLNCTFQKAQDFSDPTSPWYGGQIAYIPWYNASAIVNAVWHTWDFNYSFIYTGERYHNSANIPENYEQPWYTHDITLGKTFHFKQHQLKVSAEVNNLLNQYYDVVQNYPMPGRNFKIIMKLIV